MSPSSMSMRRLTSFIAVVFPAPEGPTRQQISPAGIGQRKVLDCGGAAARIALRHVVEDDLGGRAAHRCSVVGWRRQAERSPSCSRRHRRGSSASTPAEAFAAAEDGALIVDIRSDSSSARDGVVPGSLHVPRTVLEWRFAPDSASRSPHVVRPGGAGHRAVRPRLLVRARSGRARRPRVRARGRRRRRLRRVAGRRASRRFPRPRLALPTSSRAWAHLPSAQFDTRTVLLRGASPGLRGRLAARTAVSARRRPRRSSSRGRPSGRAARRS